MITIKIEHLDRALPVIRAIGTAVRPERINPVVGRATANTFRTHLFGLDNSRPNVLGGARTHFYASAARGTHFDVLPDGVLISVNQIGIRHRVVGGTITPKRKKFLTIPARAEAHGKRASEFNDLVVVFGKGGRPVALARAAQSLIGYSRDKASGRVTGGSGVKKRGTAGGEVMFWLVKSATHTPDPTIVPSEDQLGASISSAVGSHVQRAVDRARTT